MTHHEDRHQGNRLLLVGVTVLVVSSPMAAAASPPPSQVTHRDIGTIILLCTTAVPGERTVTGGCRVVIRTPLR